jgi:hypothetical protein
LNTYYHINRNPDCLWNAGDEFYFGQEHNYRWRSFLENGRSVNLNGEKHTADKIIKTALNCYLERKPFPVQMNDYRCNPVATLNHAAECLDHSMNIIRELAFEAIRKEFYPELPSRQRCIWLTPNDELSLQFWKNKVSGKIFRVETEGVIHRAPEKWMIMGTIPLNEINSLAHNYWKGNDAGGFEDEILFEGKLKIVEELTDISI